MCLCEQVSTFCNTTSISFFCLYLCARLKLQSTRDAVFLPEDAIVTPELL